MLPTRGLSMHGGALVFFFWVLGEVMVGRGASFVFLCFQCVSIRPEVFFKMFPIAPQFYPNILATIQLPCI